jgi:hypothetical protein
MDKNQKHLIRYLIRIYDNANKKIRSENTCAVFILPQGQELTPSFTYHSRIRELSEEQIPYSRIIFVSLLAGSTYNSLGQVKEELNSIIPSYVQEGLKKAVKKGEVPYLTTGDQLGVRKTVV